MSVTILIGDVSEQLATLPADSIDCVVTSPPYYAQRSYLPDGHPAKALEIGLEATPEDFVQRLACVFREVRRVLKPTGTLWLNIGDTSGSGGRGGGGSFTHERRAWTGASPGWRDTPGLKRKDIIGVPWMLAAALRAGWSACRGCDRELRADLWPRHEGQPFCYWCLAAGCSGDGFRRTELGWYLRAEIIWEKPNAFPESVVDRPTKAHEQIFLLSKGRHYFYDWEAIAEATSPNSHARAARGRSTEHKWFGESAPGGQTIATKAPSAGRPVSKSKQALNRSHGRVRGNEDFHTGTQDLILMRNKRSVWRVHTAQYKDEHFATFAPDLIEPCILAGCPAGGTVLDPFGGSGTTGQVADALGRKAVLIDLNPACERMMKNRLEGNQRKLIA